jgi:hypothetical protein
MKTQNIFFSSRNRDTGTPSDLSFTFPNGLIKESSVQKTSIELAEFSINRHWYDVQAGVNDSFKVYRAVDQQTFTITLSPGWYTINKNNPGAGTTIDNALTSLLTNIVGGIWGVQINDLTGVMAFTTPAGNAGGSYQFDFTAPNNRCNELLGFHKAVFPSARQPLVSVTNESIIAPKVFNLSRTPLLVMHTDLQPAFPQCSIDNLGIQPRTPFDNSDIVAVIPVDQPPRGLVNYQATEKINRIWIKSEEVRTMRIFFTDEREIPVDLSQSEWTAVFRVVYGDNLSV